MPTTPLPLLLLACLIYSRLIIGRGQVKTANTVSYKHFDVHNIKLLSELTLGLSYTEFELVQN